MSGKTKRPKRTLRTGRVGRPSCIITDKMREKVKSLKALGCTHEYIAHRIGISETVLEKQCQRELQFGRQEKVEELYAKADQLARRGNSSMIKWLEKRYQERYRAEEEAKQATATIIEPETIEMVDVSQRPRKLGKKEQRHVAATKVEGKYAPPTPPPPKLLN